MITYYISDQMRGKPDHNTEAFLEAEKALQDWLGNYIELDEGYEIVNPARNFDGDHSRPRFEYMKLDLRQVIDADVIVLGLSWLDSPGARLEAEVAIETGKHFREVTRKSDGTLGFALRFPEEVREKLSARKQPSASETVREFESGADRDTVDRKHDYEGFLSPYAIRAFGAYMHHHRTRRDGTLRESDNWQRGIPLDVYMKSAYRHFMDWWCLHRGLEVRDFDGNTVDFETALCGLLFNVQGYLHERHAEGTDERRN